MKTPTSSRRKPAAQPAPNPWPEAMATVITCKYDFAAGRALAFGSPASKHFRITFNYWAPNADGKPELHTSELISKTYLPQGHLFPIHYNPTDPHHHSHTNPTPTKLPLLAFGLTGSLILSTAWFFLLRGCH